MVTDAMTGKKVAPKLSRASVLSLLITAPVAALSAPEVVTDEENGWNDPIETVDVSLVESEMLVFLSGGPRTPAPKDAEEARQRRVAMAQMNARLREWLR